MNTLFNKVLGENEKCLLFLLKNLKELLGQLNNAIIIFILHMREQRGKYFLKMVLVFQRSSIIQFPNSNLLFLEKKAYDLSSISQKLKMLSFIAVLKVPSLFW